ncbi:orthology [Trypanosoma cruzi]|nr:orthology [Trypanosoma cruzi]RNC51757.1 hypothetical protein TcCL_ESM11092 [Trypanosoma cruzi]
MWPKWLKVNCVWLSFLGLMARGESVGVKEGPAAEAEAEALISAGNAMHASLVGVTVKDATLQEDLEFAAGVLRRAVAQMMRVGAQKKFLPTSEKSRMKTALVLDTIHRMEEAMDA